MTLPLPRLVGTKLRGAIKGAARENEVGEKVAIGHLSSLVREIRPCAVADA